jgi:hypothetical protein
MEASFASRLESCQLAKKPQATEKTTTRAIQFIQRFMSLRPFVERTREWLGRK